MKSHRHPFENRWTSGEHAWHWYCELERIGMPNVRAMFADHEMHHADDSSVVSDVPAGFVRAGLAFMTGMTIAGKPDGWPRSRSLHLSPLWHPSSRCCGPSDGAGPVYRSL
jgi:hypothetical protein